MILKGVLKPSPAPAKCCLLRSQTLTLHYITTFLHISFCKAQYTRHSCCIFHVFFLLCVCVCNMQMLMEPLLIFNRSQSFSNALECQKGKKNPARQTWNSKPQNTCKHPASPRPLHVNVCHLVRDLQLSKIKLTLFFKLYKCSVTTATKSQKNTQIFSEYF